MGVEMEVEVEGELHVAGMAWLRLLRGLHVAWHSFMMWHSMAWMTRAYGRFQALPLLKGASDSIAPSNRFP